jgi:hypothetical protein
MKVYHMHNTFVVRRFGKEAKAKAFHDISARRGIFLS